MKTKLSSLKKLQFIGFILSVLLIVYYFLLFKGSPLFLDSEPVALNVEPNVAVVYACSDQEGCREKASFLIDGPIIEKTHKIFKDRVKENPEIKSLCLNSPGGELKIVKKFLDFLKSIEIEEICMADSYVTLDMQKIIGNQCSSACIHLLLFSENRMLISSKLPLIGVHATYSSFKLLFGKTMYLWPRAWFVINYYSSFFSRDYINKHLDFFNYSLSIRSLKVHLLTKSEFKKYNIFPQYFDQ